MKFDPRALVDVNDDPPYFDPDYPPEHFVTHFTSQGSVVHAFLWIAEGRRSKGCVIISTQVYGGDRLDSLVIPLLNSGISVMVYQPRGMWDEKHDYSLISALDDLNAGIEFLRTADQAGKRTMAGLPYRIDPDRIAVLGLSGGGGTVSLAACAENDAVRFAIAMSPSNHELFRDSAKAAANAPSDVIDFVKRETAGRVDVMRRVKSYPIADLDRLSVIHNVPRLLSKKVLIVGGSRDVEAPIQQCHIPIVKAFNDAGAKDVTDVILDSDHYYLTKRTALARIVVGWLRCEAGF